jgi:TatD DNase family protein
VVYRVHDLRLCVALLPPVFLHIELDKRVMAAAAPLALRLTDIALNLTAPMFRGWYNGKKAHEDDLLQVIDRAAQVGCSRLILTGGSASESEEAVKLACQLNASSLKRIQKIDGANTLSEPPVLCFATVGCHPTRCQEFLLPLGHSEQSAEPKQPEGEAGAEAAPLPPNEACVRPYLEKLRVLIRNHRFDRIKAKKEYPSTADYLLANPMHVVVAVGETGLDYDRLQFCDAPTQQRFFETQIRLAEEFQLPMFLHNRASTLDFCRILAPLRASIPGGVVHSFDGSLEELHQLLDLNCFIGLNGCSLKTSDNLKVAAQVPIERLMMETDAPWCDIRPTHASYAVLQGQLTRLGVPPPVAAAKGQEKSKPPKKKSTATDTAPPGSTVPTTSPQQANELEGHPVFKSLRLLQSYPLEKKEKHTMGAMIKGRNEPCSLLEVFLVLHGIHQAAALSSGSGDSKSTDEPAPPSASLHLERALRFAEAVEKNVDSCFFC